MHQNKTCCSETAIHDASPPNESRARVRHRGVDVRGVWPPLPGLLVVEGQPDRQLGRPRHRLQRRTASAHPRRQGPRRGRLHLPRGELAGPGGGYGDARGFPNAVLNVIFGPFDASHVQSLAKRHILGCENSA